MRSTASILHLDLDAFFASVEQRDKPSLRGKPVVVGGVGGRGVVATASYEARRYGVHSAMSTREARARCPHAAFLSGRFHAYHEASGLVMGLMRELSPLVEPLSLDEAFVDLAAADLDGLDVETVREVAATLKARVTAVTGGLCASVGVASSKFMAKVASDLDKPDGLTVIAPGSELEVLSPMAVTVIPGVGPATAERLRRVGIHTVAQLQRVSAEELVRLTGKAQGASLFRLARAQDERSVVSHRETKSISVEGTYEHDLADRKVLEALVTRQAQQVAGRLAKHGLAGRTVTLKVRLHDFTTLSRSATVGGATDSPALIAKLARSLLNELDFSSGVRLLGVGVSGLTEEIQDVLFSDPLLDDGDADDQASADEAAAADPPEPVVRRWMPGADVVHADLGPGWVWGAGRGLVTVRFETRDTSPGPVRTFSSDDPELELLAVAAKSEL